MVELLLSLVSGSGGTIALIVGAIVAVLGVLFGARRSGVKAERARQAKKDLQAARDKREKDDEIASLGSNDVDQRFDKWVSNK